MNTIIEITGLTEMEKKVLQALADMMYAEYNYSDVGATELSANTGIDKKQIRGVIGSLSKKNLVSVEDRSDNFGYKANDPQWEPIVYLSGDAEALVEHWQEEIGCSAVIK